MDKKFTYSIILPTYNEKDNLPIIIWLIMKHMSESSHEFEVVIVDDNSPDGTKQVALDLQKIYGEKRIVVTGREKKLGLGSFYYHFRTHTISLFKDFVCLTRIGLYIRNEPCQGRFCHHYGR